MPILVSAEIHRYFWLIPIFCLKICALLIPSQQLCFCCSPWAGACTISKKNNMLLFSSVVKHNQFHHSHILTFQKLPKNERKILYLLINLVSMQFMKISVSVKIYRHFCRYIGIGMGIGIGRVVSVQHYFPHRISMNEL